MSQQHGRRRRRDARHAVVFRDPVPVVPKFLGALYECDRVAKRIANQRATRHRGEVKDRKGNTGHPPILVPFAAGTKQRELLRAAHELLQAAQNLGHRGTQIGNRNATLIAVSRDHLVVDLALRLRAARPNGDPADGPQAQDQHVRCRALR